MPAGEEQSSVRPAQSLRRRAIGGSAWSIAGYALSQAVRLAGNLVLTRLLFPEAFAVMAMVQFLMAGLQMFSDIGIGPSLVQHPRGETAVFRHTAFTMQAGRGFGLWIAACLLAIPTSAWFQEPQLVTLIPVASMVAMISGFNSSKWFVAQRHIRLARLTMIEVAAQVTALVPMVVWAWRYESVWALVFGGLVGAWTRMLLSHYALPGPPDRFAWDAASRHALIRFGKWIFLSTLIGFAAGYADKFVLGRLMDRDMFGVYAVAMMIVSMPRRLLVRIGQSIVFPAVSRRAHLGRPELRSRLLVNREPLLLGMAVGMALLAAFGDQLVLWLWDDRYRDAAWMTSLLALGLWPAALWSSIGPALRGIGQPQYSAFGDLTRLLFMVVAMWSGYILGGTLGLLVAVTLSDVPKMLVMAIGLRQEGLSCLRQDLRASGFYVLTLGACLVTRELSGMGLPMVPMGW